MLHLYMFKNTLVKPIKPTSHIKIAVIKVAIAVPNIAYNKMLPKF